MDDCAPNLLIGKEARRPAGSEPGQTQFSAHKPRFTRKGRTGQLSCPPTPAVLAFYRSSRRAASPTSGASPYPTRPDEANRTAVAVTVTACLIDARVFRAGREAHVAAEEDGRPGRARDVLRVPVFVAGLHGSVV